MKRIAVFLAAVGIMLGSVGAASAGPKINGYADHGGGGGGCGPVGAMWQNTVVTFVYPYYIFQHTRYVCAPWGPEIVDVWYS